MSCIHTLFATGGEPRTTATGILAAACSKLQHTGTAIKMNHWLTAFQIWTNNLQLAAFLHDDDDDGVPLNLNLAREQLNQPQPSLMQSVCDGATGTTCHSNERDENEEEFNNLQVAALWISRFWFGFYWWRLRKIKQKQWNFLPDDELEMEQ